MLKKNYLSIEINSFVYFSLFAFIASFGYGCNRNAVIYYGHNEKLRQYYSDSCAIAVSNSYKVNFKIYPGDNKEIEAGSKWDKHNKRVFAKRKKEFGEEWDSKIYKDIHDCKKKFPDNPVNIKKKRNYNGTGRLW